MQYRRAFIQGGSYFFTVVTDHRAPVLGDEQAVALLRNAFSKVMLKRPFSIDAIVIMPDHLHCIWTLPDNDADFSTRWRLIKTGFSKHYDELKPVTNANRINKKQKAVWQHRFWEHCLRDERDFNQHIDYIHYNPVKHGFVEMPSLWRHSSIHRYIRKGIVDQHWASGGMDFQDDIGRE